MILWFTSVPSSLMLVPRTSQLFTLLPLIMVVLSRSDGRANADIMYSTSFFSHLVWLAWCGIMAMAVCRQRPFHAFSSALVSPTLTIVPERSRYTGGVTVLKRLASYSTILRTYSWSVGESSDQRSHAAWPA